MNRFTSGVPVVLVLSAWSIGALAADPAPATASPAVATTVATQATNASATPTRVSAASNTASDPSVQRLVCLNMSLQCFSVKPKQDDPTAKTKAVPLDLKAPDIRRVVPEVELRPTDETTEVEVEQVQVESTRPEAYVPGGIASLPWAVMHPTQAWRIFLPVPPGTAK